MKTFLFWLQIVMAWVYTVPLAYGIITGHTNGLTLAVYVIFIVYLALSLSLAVSSYRIKPDDIERKQLIWIFGQWALFVSLILIIGFKDIIWRPGDTVVCIAVSIFSVATMMKYRGLADPFSRGFLAMWCKGVPQLWLAYTIFIAQSSDGLPLITLVAGYFTALPRFIQIILAGRSGGWDRPTKGLFIGESSNVITWVLVTVVWFIFR